MDHGELSSAEARLKRVLALTAGRTGAGIGRGCDWRILECDAAICLARCYLIATALAIAERLAKDDPGNAEWQRDLSVTYRGSAMC